MRRGILWLLFSLYLLSCPAAFALADPNKTRMNLEVSGKPDGDTISGILGQESLSPVAAYDPESNRYLVVYEHVTDDFDYQIFGRIVAFDGVALGSSIVISAASTAQHAPCVARGLDGKFLVVWEDDRSTHMEIYGRLINPDGTAGGAERLLSTGGGNKYRPWVAHSSARGRFLVVWEDHRNMNGDIYGQMVEEGGSLYGTNFAIANGDDGQDDPAVAYDSAHDRFLVVWTDDRNNLDSGFDIYGQLVNADWGDPVDQANALHLTTADANFVISNAIEGQTRPSVVFDGATYNRFLVVWMDDRSATTHDIYGQFVSGVGEELSYDPADTTQNIPISDAQGNQSDPFVARDDCMSGFWVAWADDRNSDQDDIYGQLLNDIGISDEPDFAVSSFRIGELTPALAVHGNCGALAAFESRQSSGSMIGFAAIEGHAKIRVSPSPVNFGNVGIGHLADQDITISNIGHADLTLTAFEVLGPDVGMFEVIGGELNPCSDFPMVITPGSSCTLLATFVPTSVNTKTATLRISSDDPETPVADVSLIGNGFVYTEVTVIAPNGRESLKTGESMPIEWGAPASAVNFKLFYSVNNGATWVAITKGFIQGISHAWTVPSLAANKKSCLVKVVGYPASGLPVGSDRSDAPFMIEVVKLTSPDGGNTLYSGVTEMITWRKNATKSEVASVKLYYTKNNGTTWLPIETLKPITTEDSKSLTGSEWPPVEYSWSVPNVPGEKTKCKVKVVLKSATGATLGSDVSDAIFTITSDF